MFTKILNYFRAGLKVCTCKCAKEENCVSSPLDSEPKAESCPEEVLDDTPADEESHHRCDWATINAIPHCKYEELVSQVCSFSGPRRLAKRFRCAKGTFNAATFVGVVSKGKIDTYVVRVPGHATREHWTPFDAYMLNREAQVLEYISENTSAPVPRVCEYSTTFDNALGHPFIMMTELPGESAYDIWFDADYDEATAFRYGDTPSPVVEKKRIIFLRSLAEAMAKINTLSFDGIGMPMIPVDGSAPPDIGPFYQWDYSASDGAYKREACTTTQNYVSARPNSLRMSEALAANPKAQNYILGARTLLDIIFAQPVFNPEQKRETFTLQHADLDLQNILVDEEGNVTGIIDWDKCLAVPRCVGAASAPFFLQKDWMPAYLNNLDTAPHLGFTTHRYRQIYAAALAEQGCADAKYTTKSAMYHAAIMALYRCDCGDVDDFLEKVLHCVPEFRGDVVETIQAFGAGWPAGECLLERHLKQIFEPEMPDSNILADADAYTAAMDWMFGFEYESECKTEVELAKSFFAKTHSEDSE